MPKKPSHRLFSVAMWAYVLLLASIVNVVALVLVLSGALWWDRRRRTFASLMRWWGRTLVSTLRFELELRGLEHAAAGPFIVTPNHASMVDLLVTYALPLELRTVVKRSWFRSPFGLPMRLAGYIPTHPSADAAQAQATLDVMRKTLTDGLSILVFPEGKRSRDGLVHRFRRGPFELAAQSGVPVLPVAIAGTDDVSAPGSLTFTPGRKIIVEILPPLMADGDDSRGLRDAVRRAITERVSALRAELN